MGQCKADEESDDDEDDCDWGEIAVILLHVQGNRDEQSFSYHDFLQKAYKSSEIVYAMLSW